MGGITKILIAVVITTLLAGALLYSSKTNVAYAASSASLQSFSYAYLMAKKRGLSASDARKAGIISALLASNSTVSSFIASDVLSRKSIDEQKVDLSCELLAGTRDVQRELAALSSGLTCDR